jgi:Zn-dependent peptidase ImmA (M78 family)
MAYMARVPYLSKEDIERNSIALLEDYARACGVVITPPIPIEGIVEKYLKYGLEFDDMHRLFGVPRDPEREPDILGAIFFDKRRIVIDESLDPDEHPSKERRFRYTLGHDVGHERLHRPLIANDPAQSGLFDASAPSFVFRSSKAKDRVEWQADYYSSCLLMPEKLVIAAWRDCFGDTQTRVKRSPLLALAERRDKQLAAVMRRLQQDREDQVLGELVRPLADTFLVSMEAMRIRVEQLDLLLREAPRQWAFG